MRSAYSLMVNVVANGVLGVLFWVVAARLFPASQVGRDSALISAMVTLSSVCQLNLHNALPRFLPEVRRTARALLGAYAASGAAAVVLASAFVVVVPYLTDEFAFLHDRPEIAVAFVAATALWGVFALQDAALTALRQAVWVPIENSVFGAVKLLLLPALLLVGSTHGSFLAWTIAMAVLIVPVSWLLFGVVAPRYARERDASGRDVKPFERRGLGQFMAKDYAGSIFTQAALTLLPLIVAAKLGAATNAHFYMAFTIMTSFDLLVNSVTLSLTVEGVVNAERVHALTQRVLQRFAPLLIAGVVLIIVAAPLLLRPFGNSYADDAAGTLRLLAIGSLLRAPVTLFGALSRIQRHGGWLLATQAINFVLVIGLTFALLGPVGMEGVGIATIVASATLLAIVAAPLARFFRAAPA